MSMQKKSRLEVTKVKKIPNLGISGLQFQFEFTDGYKMMHKAWSGIEDEPYRF